MKQIKIFLCAIFAMVASSVMAQTNFPKMGIFDHGAIVEMVWYIDDFRGHYYGNRDVAEFDGTSETAKCIKYTSYEISNDPNKTIAGPTDDTKWYLGTSKKRVIKGWKDAYDFTEVFYDEETSVESIAVHDDKTLLDIYSAQGKKLTSFNKGVNIVRYSDGTVRKVMVK